MLDASALIELVLGTTAGLAIADELDDAEESVHVPHLADVEVPNVLRRLVMDGVVSEALAREALSDFQDLDLSRHAHEPLLDRVWALRKNVSAYDAAYLALAEVLGATLLTCDRRLARTPKIGAAVKVITPRRR